MRRRALLLFLLVSACRPATAPEEFDEVIEGTIAADDERLDDGTPYDAFEIHAKQGQRLTAILESEAFDPTLHLLGEGDAPIASNDDARFGVTRAKIDETIPADGHYKLLLLAHEGKGRGAYRLEVRLRTP